MVQIARNNEYPVDCLGTIRNLGVVPISLGQRDGFISWSEMLEVASPGDLLEIQRHFYTHFTLYLGNGKVMNLMADVSKNWAEIYEMTLEDACWYDLVRISNRDHDDIAKRYFSATPRSPSDIVKAARDLENQTVPFEISFRNCEYYSTLWRYGVGFSTQLTFLKPSRCNVSSLFYYVLELTGAQEIFNFSVLSYLTGAYQYFMASRYCLRLS